MIPDHADKSPEDKLRKELADADRLNGKLIRKLEDIHTVVTKHAEEDYSVEDALLRILEILERTD